MAIDKQNLIIVLPRSRTFISHPLEMKEKGTTMMVDCPYFY